MFSAGFVDGCWVLFGSFGVLGGCCADLVGGAGLGAFRVCCFLLVWLVFRVWWFPGFGFGCL